MACCGSIDCKSVTTAVSASAACSKACAFVAPTPRTPTSASCGKCSQCALMETAPLQQIGFAAMGANLLASHIPQANGGGEAVIGRRSGQRLSDNGADGRAPQQPLTIAKHRARASQRQRYDRH